MYEDLLRECDKANVLVKEIKFESKAKGLCKGNKIAINNKLTHSEKRCVLAEEMGHVLTTYGDILDQKNVRNRQQEERARRWAFSKLVPLFSLIKAFEIGVQTQVELSEYLSITEDFLLKSLKYYSDKYGKCVECGEYIIYFEPLIIVKKF